MAAPGKQSQEDKNVLKDVSQTTANKIQGKLKSVKLVIIDEVSRAVRLLYSTFDRSNPWTVL